MIESAHIASDGIVLRFADGMISYIPSKMLYALAEQPGCQQFLDYDPSPVVEEEEDGLLEEGASRLWTSPVAALRAKRTVAGGAFDKFALT